MNLSTTYWVATLLLITLVSLGCAKKASFSTVSQPIETTVVSTDLPIDLSASVLDTNCHLKEPIVARANDWEGNVAYDGRVGLYSIVRAIPGSADDQWIGYVCNMPKEFKRATLRVRFSGDYYHANQFIPVTTGGQNNLYLRLSSIRIGSF